MLSCAFHTLSIHQGQMALNSKNLNSFLHKWPWTFEGPLGLELSMKNYHTSTLQRHFVHFPYFIPSLINHFIHTCIPPFLSSTLLLKLNATLSFPTFYYLFKPCIHIMYSILNATLPHFNFIPFIFIFFSHLINHTLSIQLLRTCIHHSTLYLQLLFYYCIHIAHACIIF